MSSVFWFVYCMAARKGMIFQAPVDCVCDFRGLPVGWELKFHISTGHVPRAHGIHYFREGRLRSAAVRAFGNLMRDDDTIPYLPMNGPVTVVGRLSPEDELAYAAEFPEDSPVGLVAQRHVNAKWIEFLLDRIAQ